MMVVEPISTSVAIGFLIKSASGWFHDIENSALNRGKDLLIEEGKRRGQQFLDEKKHLRHIQLALQNAAERGLTPFTTLDERDLYNNVLYVLSLGDNDALRREIIRQMSLGNAPDYALLNEKYNASQRRTALAQNIPYSDVDVTLYLKSFFEALLIELFNDPLFHDQMSDVIRTRAAMSGQESLEHIEHTMEQARRSLEEIVAAMHQIGSRPDDTYSTAQFEREVNAYLHFVEEKLRDHKLVMGVVLSRGEEKSPALDCIFVPLRISSKEKGWESSTDNITDISALLEQHAYVVLLGGPGSGKSTTTRYLAWSHANTHIDSTSTPPTTPATRSTASFDEEADDEEAEKILSGQPVPLHIELRLYNDAAKKHPHSFLSYMTDVVLKTKHVHVSPTMFEQLLERRAMLVLFDGLDEVPLSDRKQLVEDIEYFAQRYPGNRILVTSRPVGYDLVQFTDRLFQHGRVLDFDDTQIRQFIENWYRHVLKFATIPDEEQQEIDVFYNTVKNRENLHKLAVNPLLLTVMTALHRYKRLPDERNALYEQCADLLLETWAKLKDETRLQGTNLSSEAQKACLAHIGFILHSRAQEQQRAAKSNTEQGEKDIDEDTAVDVPQSFLRKEIKKFLKEQELPGVEPGKEAERFLNLVKVEAGLLVERGTDETGEALYGFVHRTFQEYFASVDVYKHYEEEGDATIIRDFLKKYAYDPHWREVVLLLLSKLPHKLVTRQLHQLLNYEDYPKYKDVTQQDLFFVALCLEEGISVENNFAEEILSRLHTFADSSPFPSQQESAIRVFIHLCTSRLYSEMGRRHVKSLLEEASTASLSRAIEIARIVYQSSPAGFHEQSEGARLLLARYQQGGLSVQEQVELARIIYVNSPDGSSEQAEGLALLRRLFEQAGVSVQQQVELAQVIYVNSPDGPSERAEGLALLRRLFKQGGLSVQEQVELAQVIYVNSPRGLSEQSEGARLLLARYQQGGLSVQEQVELAQAIYVNSPRGSSERAEGLVLLRRLFKQAGVSVQQQVKLAQAIYWYSPGGSSERAEGLALLQRSIKQAGVSVQEQVKLAQAIYWYSPGGSSERAEGLALIQQLLQDTHISLDERLQLVILPCTVHINNVLERLVAVQAVCSLIPADEAKRYIDEKWQGMYYMNEDKIKNDLSLSDIEAMYEMAKMDVLPERARDEMYELLNRVVEVRGMSLVGGDEDEDGD